MSQIEQLAEYFSKFPGIGPRAAKRFVYFLLSRDVPFVNSLADHIRDLKRNVFQCQSCFRWFQEDRSGKECCEICSDEHTDRSILLICEKDADFENIKKMDVHCGRYFILGGTIPILEKEPTKKIRARELFDHAQTQARSGELKEIILALSATPEGENTEAYVLKILEPLAEKYRLKLSVLGRGLSTGTELEYSDADTFKNALKNRNQTYQN